MAPQKVRVEPGRQTHFCVIHSPKSANLLNYFFAWNSRASAVGADPAQPIVTPLNRRRAQWSVVDCDWPTGWRCGLVVRANFELWALPHVELPFVVSCLQYRPSSHL